MRTKKNEIASKVRAPRYIDKLQVLKYIFININCSDTSLGLPRVNYTDGLFRRRLSWIVVAGLVTCHLTYVSD